MSSPFPVVLLTTTQEVALNHAPVNYQVTLFSGQEMKERNRPHVVPFRLSTIEHTALTRAARAKDWSLSQYVIHALVGELRKEAHLPKDYQLHLRGTSNV